jgi:hypothetical protein
MRYLMSLLAVAVLSVSVPVKADPILGSAGFAAGYYAANTRYDEPHWSFRDGCTAKTVQAAGGGYSFSSYDHCRSLPRVYGGVEWKPTNNVGKPNV